MFAPFPPEVANRTVDETEIQIADEAGGSVPEPSAEAPYRNLWVPLVVVPAAVVIAMVIVVALLGSLAGEERSMSENLELIVSGGKNQRQQALFSLVRQATENLVASSQGEEAPWPTGTGFADRATRAIEGLGEDEHTARLALSVALAHMDPRGVGLLIGTLDMDAQKDPGGEVRLAAVVNLGLLGDARAVPHLIGILGGDNQDEGLRTAAAGALGLLEGPLLREALVAALMDSSLKVRGTAAFSLSKLDPPAHEAGPVLLDLTDVATYERVHAQDPSRYARARDVSANRILALGALARLGRPDDWAHIQSLRDDPDANVVDVVLRLLRDREDG